MRLRLRDRARRVTVAVVLGIYALAATVGASLVVCAEPDGRVVLEWRGAGCCAPAGDGQPGRAPAGPSDVRWEAAANHAESGCGPCIDVPAAERLASRAAESPRVPSPPSPAEFPAVATAVAAVAQWGLPAPALFAGPRAPPIAPPPLAEIRTVVLRC